MPEEKQKTALPAAGQERARETVYTVKELAEASRKQFGCSYEMVVAAFLYAGKKEATLAEAKKLVSKFRKEV